MTQANKTRIGLVGTDSLRGKEIKNVLEKFRLPAAEVDFFDNDVEGEFSKLTDFRGQARVIQPLSQEALEGVDIVIFASGEAVSKEFGRIAAKKGFQTLDMSGAFNTDTKIPLIVTGINDASLSGMKPPVIANPHPVTIILCHLLNGIKQKFDLAKALSVILQPVSAYEDSGIEELADQSAAMLSGSSVNKKLFKTQIAFNILSQTGKVDIHGFSSTENQILAEIRRIFNDQKFPLSISLLQAPVFHGYSIATYLEFTDPVKKEEVEAQIKSYPFFQFSASSPTSAVTSISVAGKDKICVGQVKKAENLPNGFWLWTVADNFTRGSVLNALEILERLIAER